MGKEASEVVRSPHVVPFPCTILPDLRYPRAPCEKDCFDGCAPTPCIRVSMETDSVVQQDKFAILFCAAHHWLYRSLPEMSANRAGGDPRTIVVQELFPAHVGRGRSPLGVQVSIVGPLRPYVFFFALLHHVFSEGARASSPTSRTRTRHYYIDQVHRSDYSSVPTKSCLHDSLGAWE